MDPDRFRLLAFSDLHGKWFKEASAVIDQTRPDWIVLCGDLLPDFRMISGQESRLVAQRDFWRTYRSTFIRDFARTTLVRGNHEIKGFRDPDLGRLPAGLERHVVRLEGTPAEFGSWGWSREWEEERLAEELQEQLREVAEPRIYISHVPPFGCLDQAADGKHIGHRPLFQHLQGRNWPEALVLSGHVHESFGSMTCGGTLVVNAACGYALLEWAAGMPTLLAMERLQTRTAQES